MTILVGADHLAAAPAATPAGTAPSKTPSALAATNRTRPLLPLEDRRPGKTPGQQFAAPVPPHAEAAAVPVAGGGYCYDGPHPQNTAAAAGPPWDNAPGRHIHFYAPIDMRLFVARQDCYHFIGDPSDFGFDGRTQAYYGAHPLPHSGWCYMAGGHQHAFEPFAPQFVMVGPWLHWKGEFDATFWSQWPYYSVFFKDLYPRFYGDGQWTKDRKAAPRLPPGYWTNREPSPPASPLREPRAP